MEMGYRSCISAAVMTLRAEFWIFRSLVWLDWDGKPWSWRCNLMCECIAYKVVREISFVARVFSCLFFESLLFFILLYYKCFQCVR